MFKFTNLAIFATLCVASIVVAQDGPHIRFVSAIDGPIVINSDQLDAVPLEYQQVSAYQAVAGGSLIVNVTMNGVSMNTVPLLISFNSYSTCAAVYKNGSFFLVLFNETGPSSMFSDNTTGRAWIRLIDLGESIRYVSMQFNATETPIFSYVGYLESTPYIPISVASITQLIGLETANTNSSDFNITFQSNPLVEFEAYTIFFFTPNATAPNGIVVFDRIVFNGTFPIIATTGLVQATTSMMTSGQTPAMTSGQSAGLTSGSVPHLTSGARSTSGSISSNSGSTTSAQHTGEMVSSEFESSSSATSIILSTAVIAMLSIFAL